MKRAGAIGASLARELSGVSALFRTKVGVVFLVLLVVGSATAAVMLNKTKADAIAKPVCHYLVTGNYVKGAKSVPSDVQIIDRPPGQAMGIGQGSSTTCYAQGLQDHVQKKITRDWRSKKGKDIYFTYSLAFILGEGPSKGQSTPDDGKAKGVCWFKVMPNGTAPQVAGPAYGDTGSDIVPLPGNDSKCPAQAPSHVKKKIMNQYGDGQAIQVSLAFVKDPKKDAEMETTSTAPGASITPDPQLPGQAQAEAEPYGGDIDPAAVLGIVNPICNKPGLSKSQTANCALSGGPESAYPIGNYGWDVHLQTEKETSAWGIAMGSAEAWGASLLLKFLSVIWIGMIYAVKLILSLLGWALSFQPLANKNTMGEMQQNLWRFYQNFGQPLLYAALVILGCWGVFKLMKREVGQAIGGIAASLAMMLLGAFIIHSPQETVGRLANLSNQLALSVTGAASGGSLKNPTQSYAGATQKAWTSMTAVPFCALNFSDVEWCMNEKPDDEAKEIAFKDGMATDPAFVNQAKDAMKRDFRKSRTKNTLDNRINWLETQLPAFVEARASKANSIRSLYLNFGPNSNQRNDLFDYYYGVEGGGGITGSAIGQLIGAFSVTRGIKNGEGAMGKLKGGLKGAKTGAWATLIGTGADLAVGGIDDVTGATDDTAGAAPDKVSMQTTNGFVARMALLFLTAVALLGAILLFGWLAIRLVGAAAIAMVMLLATPFVMLFPAFGEAGRAAFARWGKLLVGSILAKVIFAAMLGITLLITKVVAGTAGGSGAWSLLALAGVWWLLFLQRDTILAALRLDETQEGGTAAMNMMGAYTGYRLARELGGTGLRVAGAPLKGLNRGARSIGDDVRGGIDSKNAEAIQRTGIDASQTLDSQAEQYLNHEAQQQRDMVSSYESPQGVASRQARDQEIKQLQRDPSVRAYQNDPASVPPAQAQTAARQTARLNELKQQRADHENEYQAARAEVAHNSELEAQGVSPHTPARMEAARQRVADEGGVVPKPGQPQVDARDLAKDPQQAWRAGGLDPKSDAGQKRIVESITRSRSAVSDVGYARDSQLRQVTNRFQAPAKQQLPREEAMRFGSKPKSEWAGSLEKTAQKGREGKPVKLARGGSRGSSRNFEW